MANHGIHDLAPKSTQQHALQKMPEESPPGMGCRVATPAAYKGGWGHFTNPFKITKDPPLANQLQGPKENEEKEENKPHLGHTFHIDAYDNPGRHNPNGRPP